MFPPRSRSILRFSYSHMNRFTPFLRIAPLALLLASPIAYAQSAGDYQALKKQLQDYQAATQKQMEQLQTEVKKLRDEKADSIDGPLVSNDEAKIKLDPGVTAMTFFGDLRMRYQYDQYQ